MTILREFSRFAVRVRDGDVEREVLRDARRRVTDITGIALAASGMEPARVVDGVIAGWGGEEQASVIGHSDRYPTASAAAEAVGASGLDLLAAVAAGTSWSCGWAWPDTTCSGKLDLLREGPARHLHRRDHGAALAAAMVYGLDEDDIGHAVAISASMGAGIIARPSSAPTPGASCPRRESRSWMLPSKRSKARSAWER